MPQRNAALRPVWKTEARCARGGRGRKAPLPALLEDGALERIRTSDHRLRRAVLYPAELRARVADCRMDADCRRPGRRWITRRIQRLAFQATYGVLLGILPAQIRAAAARRSE